MKDLDLLVRKFELMRIRWRILNGRTRCIDEETQDGALWWLDREIIALNEKQPLAG
ncbi:hypothetical protein [Fontibacillus sp. BL9]|uniref:hypothetical protein n=1 Tax=Fontibacillus sp. BL9 TaxID=3389971 RepID=UPI0039783DA0